MDDYHHHIFGGKMNTKSNKSATKKGLWAPIAFIATLVWVIIMGIGAGVSIIVDTLVGIAFFVIKITIILALLANRAWKKVARFFKYEWKKNYVRLTNPQPACEICNDTTVKMSNSLTAAAASSMIPAMQMRRLKKCSATRQTSKIFSIE